MKETFMRLIAGQTFFVYPEWGFQRLQEIEAMSEIVASQSDMFEQMREQSQMVDYYSGRNLQGITDEGEQIIRKGSVASVYFGGLMTVEDSLCHYGVRSFERTMRELYANPSVSAIVVRMNSGGGQSAAGNLFYNTILDRNKPVIGHITMAASGGYLGLIPADELVVETDMGQVGSIGVMMTFPKYYMEEDDGYKSLYSEDSPRKNEIWRELEKGNTELVIRLLTELDGMFMNRVRKHRKLKGKEPYQKESLSGAMFRANNAKRRGLIDSVGSFNYALARASSAIKYFNK